MVLLQIDYLVGDSRSHLNLGDAPFDPRFLAFARIHREFTDFQLTGKR
jgi:hypothetical protein